MQQLLNLPSYKSRFEKTGGLVSHDHEQAAVMRAASANRLFSS
jgi:hypothetical protein